MPLPYEATDKNLGIAWLYTCAPQIYSVSANGYAEGYSTSLVAYIITPQSAQHLLDHAAKIEATKGPVAYSPWDSDIDYFLRDRGFPAGNRFRLVGFTFFPFGFRLGNRLEEQGVILLLA